MIEKARSLSILLRIMVNSLKVETTSTILMLSHANDFRMKSYAPGMSAVPGGSNMVIAERSSNWETILSSLKRAMISGFSSFA